MIKWSFLIIGGIVGTVARYTLAGFVYQVLGSDFPYGTLVVNLVGCFLIGLFSTLAEVKFLLDSNMRVLLMIGFCGAFTTFSTFMLETGNLIRDGETMRAFANVLLSLVVGFLVFRIGIFLGEVL
jgi:CrcB protein